LGRHDGFVEKIMRWRLAKPGSLSSETINGGAATGN
jgi:hypothetical protein